MWWFNAHELQASAYPESTVQKRVKEYLQQGMRFDLVVDFSQGRETQQTPGIPDLFAVHIDWDLDLWIEVKQPEIRAAGVRGNTTKIVQHRGKWRWKQEEYHRILQAANKHVVTVDHPEEVAAYVAYLGYPVDPNLYRTAFDPAAQERFRDPKAYARWIAEELRTQTKRRQARATKRGSKVTQTSFEVLIGSDALPAPETPLGKPLIDFLSDIVSDETLAATNSAVQSASTPATSAEWNVASASPHDAESLSS
jgi:uncharacterized protein YaeQ